VILEKSYEEKVKRENWGQEGVTGRWSFGRETKGGWYDL